MIYIVRYLHINKMRELEYKTIEEAKAVFKKFKKLGIFVELVERYKR